MRKVLMIDNFDSFTYNLVQGLASLGSEVEVYRNNAITVDEAKALAPDFLVVSPGPGRPKDAGISMEMIEAFAPSIPTLGVCLGHQCIVGVQFHPESIMTSEGMRLMENFLNIKTGGRHES